MTLSPKSTQSRAGKTLRRNPFLGLPPQNSSSTNPPPLNPNVVCCYREIRATVITKHADVVPRIRRVRSRLRNRRIRAKFSTKTRDGDSRPDEKNKKKKPYVFLYFLQETFTLDLFNAAPFLLLSVGKQIVLVADGYLRRLIDGSSR